MFQGVGFGAAQPFADFPSDASLPRAECLSSESTIADIAQRTLKEGEIPLLDEHEYRIVAAPFKAEALGVDPHDAQKVRAAFSLLGPEIGLVGHWNPDLDCVASVAIARYLLNLKGKKAHLFVSGAKNGGTAVELPGLKNPIEFQPISELPAGLPFVLIDAPNSDIAHVSAPAGCKPSLVIDTHCGETNGTLACVSNQHAAVSTIMLSVLLDEVPLYSRAFDTPPLRELATLAFLGIMTDTASLRRASPYDIEAVRVVLPYLENEILRDYNQSAFERDISLCLKENQTLSIPGSPRIPGTFYGRENEFLICCLGAQPPSRHNVIAAAADEICFRHSGESPLAVLLVYRDEKAQALTGILRIDVCHPDYARFDIQSLLAQVFPGKRAGHRGGNVGGGRITGVADLSAAQAGLIARYYSFAQAF